MKRNTCAPKANEKVSFHYENMMLEFRCLRIFASNTSNSIIPTGEVYSAQRSYRMNGRFRTKLLVYRFLSELNTHFTYGPIADGARLTRAESGCIYMASVSLHRNQSQSNARNEKTDNFISSPSDVVAQDLSCSRLCALFLAMKRVVDRVPATTDHRDRCSSDLAQPKDGRIAGDLIANEEGKGSV